MPRPPWPGEVAPGRLGASTGGQTGCGPCPVVRTGRWRLRGRCHETEDSLSGGLGRPPPGASKEGRHIPMNKVLAALLALGLMAVVAAPASAEELTSARDIQAAVDSYLASRLSRTLSLVGGPGSAGYDAGFWIRGGDFLLRRSNLNAAGAFRVVQLGCTRTMLRSSSTRRSRHRVPAGDTLGLLVAARDDQALRVHGALRHLLLHRARVRPLGPRTRSPSSRGSDVPERRPDLRGALLPEPWSTRSAVCGQSEQLRHARARRGSSGARCDGLQLPHGSDQDPDDCGRCMVAPELTAVRGRRRWLRPSTGTFDAGLHGPQPRPRLHGARHLRL